MDIDELRLNKGVAIMFPVREEKKRKSIFGINRMITFLNYELDIKINIFTRKRRMK
jgi:hypothetical protein